MISGKFGWIERALMSPRPIAEVVKTSAGPVLYIAGIRIRDWLGTDHGTEAEALVEKINTAMTRDEHHIGAANSVQRREVG